MDNLQFYEYVLSLLAETGHVVTSFPIYANHSASEALYIDSTKDVAINRFDRELLTRIDNVSFLADIRWEGIVDDLDENVQIYSIAVNFPERVRSQNVADIHHLLQRYWSCSHSIVFFKNQNSLVISFADNDCSHILSDWWDIEKSFYDIVERIDIGDMSVENSADYFLDFIYACARDYYIYPVSFEEASYGLMSLDYISKSLVSDIPLSRDEIKEMIQRNLVIFEESYGDDYVDPVYTGMEDIVKYHNISDEIDRISFELELEAESDEHFEDFDFEEDDFYDDYGEDDVDPSIFDDPVLMVKWLEKRQKEHDGSPQEPWKHQNQGCSETEYRDRKHFELLQPEAVHCQIEQSEYEESKQNCVETDTLPLIRDDALRLREEAERQANEEAERKARELDRVTAEYEVQVSAIRNKYDVKLEDVKRKLRLNISRCTDIENRLARLNILQFVEKRNLRNEKEALEKQQQELSLMISRIENELGTYLEREKKKYQDAVSMI